MKLTLRLSIASLCLLFCRAEVSAQVKLAGLFTDNMVLQQQTAVPVWGWDKPGAAITVTNTWDKKVYKTIAGTDGKFMLKITTPAFGGPYELTVSDGKAVTLKNV